MSIKNSNDSIGNRNRDLPACSTVLQPTALPRAPYTYVCVCVCVCVSVFLYIYEDETGC
jgi:hypothetical protein